MVILLLAAAAIYAALGEQRNALVMAIALVPILGVDVLLEGRAERTLDRLRVMTEPKVRVRRDGDWMTLPVELLVPDDVIGVQEGDVLAADCRLLDGSDVIVDESTLTGESRPVVKDVRGDDKLFAGTVLLSGRGIACVTTTGPATEYGKIGTLVAGLRPVPTPLQRSISHLVRRLFVVAIAVCLGVVFLGLLRGSGARESFIGGVSLAIAAMPEEFPIVYALYLTLGVWRLAGKHALIRRMVGVETLGSTSVICTDKTGTLTFGHMELTDAWTPDGSERRQAELIDAAALACEPDPFDPLEQAIVARAPQAQTHGRLVHEYPFDPVQKRMSHIWDVSGAGLRLYAKGAVEGLIRRSNLPPEARATVERANEAMAERGVRVLGVASRTIERISGDREVDEASLEFLGLIGLTDPVRPEVPAAVAACHDAGIRILMLTGDHPTTALAVARQAGIADRPRVLSADLLDDTDERRVRAAIAEADVFARICPEEKLRLVQHLRQQGQTVAMTGDGINDAPALRAADIGVAMGIRGTEVAREAATIVLLDDNFSTIVAAVREGRRILTNVRRAFGYLVAFHVPILASAIAAPIVGVPLLLEPIHLVWLELLVHPLAALAFEGDEAPPELMQQPPRSRNAPLIANVRLLASAITGLGAFAIVWGVYCWSLAQSRPEPLARNFAFTTFVLAQIGLVLAERSEGHRTGRSGARNGLMPLLLAMAALSTLLPYLPGAPALLRLAPLGPREWLLAVLLGAAVGLWAELVQVVARMRAQAGPGEP